MKTAHSHIPPNCSGRATLDTMRNSLVASQALGSPLPLLAQVILLVQVAICTSIIQLQSLDMRAGCTQLHPAINHDGCGSRQGMLESFPSDNDERNAPAVILVVVSTTVHPEYLFI